MAYRGAHHIGRDAQYPQSQAGHGLNPAPTPKDARTTPASDTPGMQKAGNSSPPAAGRNPTLFLPFARPAALPTRFRERHPLGQVPGSQGPAPPTPDPGRTGGSLRPEFAAACPPWPLYRSCRDPISLLLPSPQDSCPGASVAEEHSTPERTNNLFSLGWLCLLRRVEAASRVLSAGERRGRAAQQLEEVCRWDRLRASKSWTWAP